MDNPIIKLHGSPPIPAQVPPQPPPMFSSRSPTFPPSLLPSIPKSGSLPLSVLFKFTSSLPLSLSPSFPISFPSYIPPSILTSSRNPPSLILFLPPEPFLFSLPFSLQYHLVSLSPPLLPCSPSLVPLPLFAFIPLLHLAFQVQGP
jgi:hypothetical protein